MMRSCCAGWLIALLMAAFATTADARTWKVSKTSFEAEIVDVNGRIVRLRCATGEIVDYLLGSFRDEDRKAIDQWLLDEQGQPQGDEIKIDAIAFRDGVRTSADGPPAETVLVVVLKVHGKDAVAATSLRDITIEEAVTDTGAKAALSTQTRGYGQSAESLERYGDMEQPTWGFRTRLIWELPQTPVKAFGTLRGSFKMTTGRPKSFEVDLRDNRKNRLVEHEALSLAGLQATLNPSPGGAGIFMDGRQKRKEYFLKFEGPMAHICSVEMLDSDGKLIDRFAGRGSAGSSWHDQVSGKQGENKTYQFEFGQPAPANMRMRVTVLEDAHEVQIPFTFTNLAVP